MMSNPFRERCVVLENTKVAPGHYVMRLNSVRISKKAKPGQFVQVVCSNGTDPLLPRPFSFLDADNKSFSFLYQLIGKGTKILAALKKGDEISILGPLGNGFFLSPNAYLLTPILVGGGVGIPPLYHLAKTTIKSRRIKPSQIHVFLGARDKALLLCEKEFKKLGVNFKAATDNGSKGHCGFVTHILEAFLDAQRTTHNARRIYTCGPTPMLKAVSVIAQKYETPCQASVEVPMACGFGACLGCAIKVRRSTQYAERSTHNEYCFAIACTEGPVFEAKDIVWD